MAGDILDFLSNNWGTILGINPAQAEAAATNGPALGGGPYGGAPTPPPNSLGFQGGNAQTPIAPPPASVMNSAGPSFSPSGAVDQPVFTDPMSGAPMPGPVSGAPYNVGYGGGPQPPTPPPSGPGTAAAAVNPNAPVPGFTPPPGQGYPGGEIATSTGPVMPTGQGFGGGSSSALGQTAGGLGQALGLPAPRYEGGVATPANPNIGGQFGLQRPPFLQTQAGQDMITRGLAGLGRGLSTIGGNTGLGAFARGAGGSLTGGVNELNAQQGQLRAAQNDLFLHSSTAFRDMLASQAADNTAEYNKARSQYFSARATQMQLGGSGTNAWQNTPYGKVIQVENEAQKYEKGQQIILQKRWAMNGSTPEQQQQDLDNLQKQTDSYRGRLYKQAGIDPDKAEKLKDMGTSSDKPFQTKGMTLQQFDSQVPMGGWYTDQNGVVRQRTVPPAGTAAPQAAAAAPTTTDYLASQPAEQPTGALQ